MSRKKRNSRKRPKRREPAAVVVTPADQSDRLSRRLSRMRPRSFSGEPIEDIAVFDDLALGELPEEIADQVVAVREALSAITEARDQQAAGRLDGIPRRSVLSPWRLFVRGLADWYQGDFEQAAKSFDRLDRTRRPGRIAAALQLAGDESGESATRIAKEPGEADSELQSAAKLVQRIRVERPALAEARRETARRERTPGGELPDEVLGPVKLSWLIGFCREHRRREPRLVEALQQAALQRAFQQPYCDIFAVATAKLPGTAHDPKNLLLQSEYHGRFEDGERKAKFFLDRYLEQDLASNDRISEPLRAAIASTLYLQVARQEMMPDMGGGMLSAFMMMDEQEDCRAVEDNFKKSIKAYPGNAVAHRERIDWIRSHADNDRNTKAERDRFAKKLSGAMVDWSNAIPDQIEPRLWLVDHFLEEEQLDKAQPHVEWLSASRHADPRVRATPWKWNVLEAMRLCRRKAWLAGVQDKLDAAAGLWPSWLPQPWLAYLQAALALRSGQQDEYRRLRSLAREGLTAGEPNDAELADAAMMLGAAQRMRVPAADLKPLRTPVDDAVKNLQGLTTPQLVIAGGFFYDLHRTGLLYPAYRMHGGKFAAEYHQRLKRGVEVRRAQALGDAFWRSIFWLAERRSFSNGYELKVPKPLERLRRDPKLAAVKLQMLLSHRYSWRLREMTREIDLVREASQAETDVYLRYWFTTLVDRSNEEIAKNAARNSFFGSASPFGRRFGPLDDDDADDDWEDDDDSFDPECECPECTAARQRLGIPHSSPGDHDREDDEEDWSDDASDSSPRGTNEYDDSMPLFERIDVGIHAGMDADDEESSPINVDLVPPRTPTPKPKMDVDLDFRRKRPKNPMKKRKKSR